MAANPIATPELEIVAERKPTIDDKIAELRNKRTKIESGGGKKRIEKHHTAGLLTARERVEKLVDPESFQEIGAFAKHRSTYFGMAEKELPADGVVTGCAAVDGRLVHLASQDFTVAGGAAGEVHCAKITDMPDTPACFTTTLCCRVRFRRFLLSAAPAQAAQLTVRRLPTSSFKPKRVGCSLPVHPSSSK